MNSLIRRIRSKFTASEEPSQVITDADFSVLFVCMGNICRSPTVEGVFRQLVAAQLPDRTIAIDSAGTHAYHVGEAPDPRARQAAERRGIDLSGLRARKLGADDFERFDLVLGMDPLNRVVMQEVCPPEFQNRIRLLLEFAPDAGREDVPDPYYGGSNGFEYVLDLAEQASAGLLTHIRTIVSSD